MNLDNVEILLTYMIVYLIGSVPFGLVLSKLFKVGDLRKSGSGNIGATNMVRVGGKKLGILTAVLDGVKGVVAVLIAESLGASIFLSSVISILGHMFPIWLKFRGGKGVATSIGILLLLDWKVGLLICIIWMLVFYSTKYSSLAAIVSISLSPILIYYNNDSYSLLYTSIIIAILVVTKHYTNIFRLLKGEEKKFKRQK